MNKLSNIVMTCHTFIIHDTFIIPGTFLSLRDSVFNLRTARTPRARLNHTFPRNGPPTSSALMVPWPRGRRSPVGYICVTSSAQCLACRQTLCLLPFLKRQSIGGRSSCASIFMFRSRARGEDERVCRRHRRHHKGLLIENVTEGRERG